MGHGSKSVTQCHLWSACLHAALYYCWNKVCLHMAQLMPLSLTVSCFSKIQIGFTFLVLAHLSSSGKRAVKRVCVCVSVRACVCVCVCVNTCIFTSSVTGCSPSFSAHLFPSRVSVSY